MKRIKHLFYLSFSFFFFTLSGFSQIKSNANKKVLGAVTASFITPDTVCTNTSIQINNTSVGASNYYWSFCEANFNISPAANNLGNPGNQLSLPVFLDIAQDASGNYFVFAVNNSPSQLIRMNFGNSLLNTPVVDNMGDFGGIIPTAAEGIQVVNVNGNWVVVINGGDPVSGSASAIIKIDLGPSLASTTGVATNWGNIGGMSYPHDLYIFTENNNWYGYTVNSDNNTLTRFNFGADLSTTPTGINLGNIGNFNTPVGFGVINSGGTWHLFVTNNNDNSISRLDFGNSLLNIPTGTNLGNLGNSLTTPRDISFVQLCNNTEGYVVNANSNSITRLDFSNNILSTPSATNLGNLGNMSFPHSISKLFRVNSDVYAFVPNVNNNSLTQLHFSGCSTPGSTLQTPSNVTYSTPGTYNINLLVDLGLPTQTSYCKQIVVKDCPLNVCNDWLYTPTQPSAVEVGQLNVTGNVITVEAEINRTTPYVGGLLYAGDVVSKHDNPSDANYLLRPNEAEITTSDGYFRTPDICEIELNKTYHVAMVYDGATLKFYRNGFLMSSVPATGTLFQNTWPTRIGYYASQIYNTNFIGYINEVRIWNVARSQAQIQAYMNTSLPSPTTQTGLLAYYTFNDLTNKQGNSAWNGTLVGGALINQTNPQCAFVADSCCPVLQGTLTGESLCAGGNATLTFNTTTGISPYTLTYSDGTNTYTQNNVQSNIPFILPSQPTANTTYTLLSIKDASSCGATATTGITANVTFQNCALTCNDWLHLPSDPSYINIGNLNIPGNQITVEAMVNLTSVFTGGPTIGSDVVTKYNNPSDVNYLLRFDHAYITTDVGFFGTPDFCAGDTNKTYHIAMVYDGATLKFYRNGFLMSQVAATGNLFQNNWQTWIGNYFSQIYNTNFIGYINEVRIWNVARTQAQIKAYMNTSLPTPTTQTGLQAYYIFNDLLNKQGNPAWNGTLGGSASINQTNPRCVFVADSCCPLLSGTLAGGSICTGSPASLTFNTTATTGPFTLQFINGTDTLTQTNVQNNVPFTLANSPATTAKYILLSIKDTTSCGASFVTGDTATVIVTACTKCSEWLHINTNQDAVDIGDLDVPGNTITVEANVNLSLYNVTYGQDLVSKHRDPSDANYLLRQNHAEITTSDGFFYTPAICDDSINKTYHLAMVYDGATLKYYRNGFLMEQVPATGNMVLNDYNTKIGNYAAILGQDDETLWGYINEVKIWNVARTQAQIRAYMNTSLPSPTTQTGLLAYYVFNDLTNKQGNAAWNGTLTGSAAINQTNPNCVFIADSCCTPLTGILKADTLCKGSGNISLTFIASNGTAPFTLTYSDGTNTFTQNNVRSNVPFVLPNQPTANTTYGLISIKDSSTCAATNVLGLLPGGYIPVIKATVVINPLPQAQLTASNICAGDDGKLLFTASTGSAPFTIQYNNGTTTYTLANLSTDTLFTVPYQVTDTTTFNFLNVTDSNKCINNINTFSTINVNPLPQGSISGNTACASDSASIAFTATSANGPFTLILSDGTNSVTYNNILSGTPFKIAPLNTTTIISLVSITNKNGCIRTTGFTSPSVTINITPSPQIQFDSLGSICIQNPPFDITQAKETSGISGSGIFSGQGVDASGNFSPLVAGTGVHAITYTYTADNGCAVSKSGNITVNQNPVANAGPDLIACINISVQLNATGGDSYAWAPPTGLNNDSIPNPIATLSSSTIYTVTVTDSNNCSATDSLVITVSPVGKALYVVPNAFSPNGDGKNDCFGIQHWGGVTLQEFSIYNRWGQLIFATKNPSECWDGSFHGKIQDAGAYVYIIRAQTACGQVSLKGTVVLIR